MTVVTASFTATIFSLTGNLYTIPMLQGFKNFILRGNVVDLAVAVVVGAAFNAVVSAFVSDFITPLIALIGGKPNFSHLYFTIHGSKFLFGSFLNALISFLINAAVIYFFVVAPMNSMTKQIKKGKSREPTEKTCPYCLNQIPSKAKKCMYCTANLK